MKKFLYTVGSFALPMLAFAQAPANTVSSLKSTVTGVGELINSLIPVLFALAIVYFFWGLITYIKAAGDPKAQEAGRNTMIYGLIAIVIMASLYGLIAWVQGAAGVTSGGSVTLPTVPLK